jgi:hypothetical protein
MGMNTNKTSVLRGLPTRLTSVKNAARKINGNHYTVMKLLLLGKLEGEMVDGEFKVLIDSIDRFNTERQAAA